MWHLAIITRGTQNNSSFSTGRHVYFRRLFGKVQVIGAGGRFAVLSIDAAKQHLRSRRNADGSLIPVRNQMKPEIKWQQYEGRRFDGYPRKVA